jgi:hypothetical protein
MFHFRFGLETEDDDDAFEDDDEDEYEDDDDEEEVEDEPEEGTWQVSATAGPFA